MLNLELIAKSYVVEIDDIAILKSYSNLLKALNKRDLDSKKLAMKAFVDYFDKDIKSMEESLEKINKNIKVIKDFGVRLSIANDSIKEVIDEERQSLATKRCVLNEEEKFRLWVLCTAPYPKLRAELEQSLSNSRKDLWRNIEFYSKLSSEFNSLLEKNDNAEKIEKILKQKKESIKDFIKKTRIDDKIHELGFEFGDFEKFFAQIIDFVFKLLGIQKKFNEGLNKKINEYESHKWTQSVEKDCDDVNHKDPIETFKTNIENGEEVEIPRSFFEKVKFNGFLINYVTEKFNKELGML